MKRDKQRIIDMIFENSKLRSGSSQLEAVCEKNIKPTVQSGRVIVNQQNAVKVDQRSEDEVEEFYTAVVQTRAQMQVGITATSLSPHTDKDVEALNVTSEESKQTQNGDVYENKHCKKAREEPVKTQMNHKKYFDKINR